MARKEELWFHAKDIPGSHVVISGNLDPSDAVKTDAAELAAYFSQGRLSNLVQVDMIEVKNSINQLVENPALSLTQDKRPSASHQTPKNCIHEKILILLEIRIFNYYSLKSYSLIVLIFAT